MRENKFLSNKSLVAIKLSLFAAVLIGLVVFVASLWPVYAGGDECPTEIQTLTGGECKTDADCDDGNPCTDDWCWCHTECRHDYNDYQETEPCGSGDCEGTRTRTCSEGSFGPWSDCSTYGDYCGDCVLVNCHIDDNPFTADLLLSGSMACDEEGYCSDEECVYGHYCADKYTDDGSYPTVSCNAPCDQDEDCGDYCEGDTAKIGTCNNEGDNPPCTCSWEDEDCNQYDGCYAYETGCEDRDYFCSDTDGVKCDYTHSNRNTDYKEDWVYYCTDSELRKHRKSHDYYCDGDTCTDHPDWVDDQLVEDCYYYEEHCEGDELWYEEGYCDPSGLVCDSKTGLVKDCYYYEEFCDDDKRMSDTGFCNDQISACDNTIAEIEDCSDNNYDECQDIYYKHHYTESCHEENGETQCLPASSLVDCRDEYWCDGQEYCVDVDGVYCEDGEPVDCSDSDECTYDNCIEDGDNTGHCENPHMDEEPPVTEKWYEGLQYPEGYVYPKWITSETEVHLDAEDQGPESKPQCAIGVHEIWYKDVYLEDEEDWHYCYEDCGEWIPNDYEDEGWVLYWSQEDGGTGPFHKEPESCHIIEYYSVDKLGNPEDVNWQCVFVDNSAPEPIKEVGKPRAKWDGRDSVYYECLDDRCWSSDPEKYIECWKTTTETLISMSCNNTGDHPVDIKGLCYRIELNAEVNTQKYCEGEMIDDEWCCVYSSDPTVEFSFKEDCEHNLEFYCIDKLDNESPIDEEKFKVGGEEFEIELNEKWNLISVPFVLLSSDPKDVFEDVKEEVLLVLTYDPDECADDGWCIFIPDTGVGTITQIKPGWGYWVLAKEHTYLSVVGTPWIAGETAPPTRGVEEGWNLIGYYGTDDKTYYHGPDGIGKQAFCALHSLSYPTYKWSALYSYWKPIGDIELNECDLMYPGAGYWIGMNQADPNYFQSTVCTGNPCV